MKLLSDILWFMAVYCLILACKDSQVTNLVCANILGVISSCYVQIDDPYSYSREVSI